MYGDGYINQAVNIMRTMNAGRKTLLALAISSAMASGSVSASQPIENLDPIPNPTEDVVIGEFQQINNLNGAAITSEAGSSGYNITNHGLLKGSQHAIHAKQVQNSRLCTTTEQSKQLMGLPFWLKMVDPLVI